MPKKTESRNGTQQSEMATGGQALEQDRDSTSNSNSDNIANKLQKMFSMAFCNFVFSPFCFSLFFFFGCFWFLIFFVFCFVSFFCFCFWHFAFHEIRIKCTSELSNFISEGRSQIADRMERS